MNKKNIFICSTEQSGENISFNILSRLDLQNINVDGVSGKRSEKFLNKKFYDISNFKSIGGFIFLIDISADLICLSDKIAKNISSIRVSSRL